MLPDDVAFDVPLRDAVPEVFADQHAVFADHLGIERITQAANFPAKGTVRIPLENAAVEAGFVRVELGDEGQTAQGGFLQPAEVRRGLMGLPPQAPGVACL